ncbi:MAG: helix-turn-helix domain-containing protein [Clostridiales bacterium]|nr:helix-turn-helix domain-containing protein [Clostridiales bacterium]
MALRNMKQADIVRLTGINKGALSSYISGKYQPKQNNIYLIAKALDVNEGWLMGHDVEMTKADSPDKKAFIMPDTLAVHFENETFSEQELQEIKDFISYIKSKRK